MAKDIFPRETREFAVARKKLAPDIHDGGNAIGSGSMSRRRRAGAAARPHRSRDRRLRPGLSLSASGATRRGERTASGGRQQSSDS